MKAISWNVNGLRACLSKGVLLPFIESEAPDFFAFQETKMQVDQLKQDFGDYYLYMHSAERKGYSGTMVLAKEEALSVEYDFIGEDHPNEGRVITLEYPEFYFVCAYVPNSKDGLLRLDYRMHWEEDFLAHLKRLDAKKPVIYCGDLNVANENIDLANPDKNYFNPGFSDEERAKFKNLLAAGFIDTYRYQHPDNVKYSWWSYRTKARERNIGWRIDYFIISNRLADKLKSSEIHNEVFGSDHCPVSIEIDL